MRLIMSTAKGAISEVSNGADEVRGSICQRENSIVSSSSFHGTGVRHTKVEHEGSCGDLLDGEGSFGLHGANLLGRLLRGGDCGREDVSIACG